MADPSREFADEFARLVAARSGGEPRTMTLLHRSDKPGTIVLRGDEKNHEIAATLAQAWSDGYTSVLFKQFPTSAGKVDIVAVRNPNQLRLIDAAFDPAKRDSSDLMASIAAMAGVPFGISMIPVDYDPFAE